MGINFRSTEAELTHLNVRKEGPNDDTKQTAIDAKFSCETNGVVLKTLLGTDYVPDFWIRDGEEIAARYIGIETIKSWAFFDDHQLNFGGLKFDSVKLKSFVFKPVGKGAIELAFQASINNPTERELCILAEMLKGCALLEVYSPPDLFDEQQDDLSDSFNLVDSEDVEDDSDDLMYQVAVSAVRDEGKASISFIQRELRIGYNRAARLIESLEKNGVISAMDSSGKRLVFEETAEA